MLIVNLWNYIRGYVIILIEGYFAEKFINICVHRQIYLWDLNKLNNNQIQLKISIKGFKSLRPIAKRTKCRVHIISKKGLPIVLSKYKKRKFFILGALVFILLLNFLTSFIWVIDVTGNEKIEKQIILESVYSSGIRPGIMKHTIDTDSVMEKLMMDISELAWIGIRIKGTTVKVEIVERVIPPTLVPVDEPCNIVAVRDGIIKSIIAKTGSDAVKPGATVKKGQILISGEVKAKAEQTPSKFVHAMGTVKARTWYEMRVAVETEIQNIERTGNVKGIYSISLFNKRYYFNNKTIPFNSFEFVETKKTLKISNDLILPFQLIIDKYYENTISQYTIDKDEARKNAAEKAYDKVKEQIPDTAEIVKDSIRYIPDGENEIAEVIIECLEDIGITERIGVK